MIEKKEIKNYLSVLLFAVLFLVLYRIVDVRLHAILIYFMLPAGLFFAYYAPFSIIFLNVLGIALLFSARQTGLQIDSWMLGLMFVATSLLPFYSKKLFIKDEKSFDEYKNILLENRESLKKELAVLENDSKKLQNEVEKITRLYLLGREFVEQMDMKEIMEHLRISIFDKPEIKSVAIFALDKQNVTPIYLSNPDEISTWSAFVAKSHDLINSEKTPKMIESSLFSNKVVVLWPVKIEEDITVALFLVTSPDFVVTCVEEGKIFIPQIALGFKRIRLFEEVREKSRRDGLTSLYLRRYFIERLEGEIQRAKRYSASFSILMIDIDHFKNINDVYGHLVGDSTLKTLAQILAESLRPGDLIGRYGGEEFIVLLPLTTLEEASKISIRLGKIISKKDFLGNYRHFNMTVSIGISHYPGDGTASQKLIEASDKALYWVKTHGRNGVKDFKAIQK